MLQITIKTIILLTVSSLMLSCSTEQENVDEELSYYPTSHYYTDTIAEPTQEMDSASKALNTLQTSTDEMNRLYSTFPNIHHPCYPADSSFTISQAELLSAMMQFVTTNCKNLPVDERENLAKAAVLGQKEYTVLHCPYYSEKTNYKNGLPKTGTWVMPNVNGSDLLIVW